MPVEVGKRDEELAKNGSGLPFLGDDDDQLTEISVQVSGVVTIEEFHSQVHVDYVSGEHHDAKVEPQH